MPIIEKNFLSHTVTSTGASQSFEIFKSPYNLSIYGTFSATINLERSFDEGATWQVVRVFTIASERIGDEPEPGTLYRFNCTSYTSGTANCRLGSYYNVGI